MDDSGLQVQVNAKVGLGKRPRKKNRSPRLWRRLHSRLGVALSNYAAQHLRDRSRATEVVEDVAHSAAKAHQHKPIENPDSYFFSGVVRRVKRVLEREQRTEYVGSTEELTTFEATWDNAGASRLDNHILAQEIIGFMDERARDLYSRWARGDEWEEIAEDLGTTADAAERRFRYALQKARERVLGSKNAKSKPLPAVAKIG